MSERSNYLLEVGTEELPVSFLESSGQELHDKLQEGLSKSQIAFDGIRIYKTPRRLAVMIQNIALVQPATQELLKGPPVSVALDSTGQMTPAGLGFAKKVGIEPSKLQRQEIDGAEYLVYEKHSPGKPISAVLSQLIPEAVLSLSGSHFMAWDESDIRFSRPIRWLVSLLGKEPLPIQIGLAQSHRVSKGHRYLAQRPEIEVSSVEAYQTELWQYGHVQVDQDLRKKLIWEAMVTEAKSLNGVVPKNEDLLNTVTLLVEAPTIIIGSFDPRYLSLPKEVITTVMASHQKYFPIESQDGKLLPYFITVSNNTTPEAAEIIRHGNEKVLKARLEDAVFFFEEDTKHPLIHYVDILKGVTFQKGLGSLWDKTQRLISLAKILSEQLHFSGAEQESVVRAAELSKADLATGMVRELTELQGLMGEHYARLSGENSDVARAIAEHYHPRFTGDTVASSRVGYLLSIIDKLDTMMAVFAQKDARLPTGSKDPMGLRRMALGIIQTVLENQLSMSLDQALTLAYQNLGQLAALSKEEALEKTRQFLLQRLKGYLLEQNYSYDAIDAILDAGNSPFANLSQTLSRLKALKSLMTDVNQFKSLYEPANRTARILGKAYLPQVTLSEIKPDLFESPAEKALYEALKGSDLGEASPSDYLSCFKAWSPIVEDFFNHVLVNVDNAEVKANRYRLLSLLNRYYLDFADFTKLVV